MKMKEHIIVINNKQIVILMVKVVIWSYAHLFYKKPYLRNRRARLLKLKKLSLLSIARQELLTCLVLFLVHFGNMY